MVAAISLLTFFAITVEKGLLVVMNHKQTSRIIVLICDGKLHLFIHVCETVRKLIFWQMLHMRRFEALLRTRSLFAVR